MSSKIQVPANAVSAGSEARETSQLSTWRILLLAFATAVVVSAIGVGLDLLILHEHESRRTAIEVSDALGGLVAGGLAFRLLQYERDRRVRLRQKLTVISDMNHHVNNALQVISFHAFSHADKKQLEEIRESMDRIQWALKEILPKL